MYQYLKGVITARLPARMSMWQMTGHPMLNPSMAKDLQDYYVEFVKFKPPGDIEDSNLIGHRLRSREYQLGKSDFL